MSSSDAKSVREHLDTAAVEGAAIDEPQRSFHGGARSLPSRREGGRLRSAPQARPKSRRLIGGVLQVLQRVAQSALKDEPEPCFVGYVRREWPHFDPTPTSTSRLQA